MIIFTTLLRLRRVALLATGALGVVLSPPLYAQETAAETPLLSESAYFDEMPIVLSVTRLAQPKSEIPAAVTVIDRDMIRASGVRKIPDLLWLVPGFQVGYDNATQATAPYHGFSDQYARRLQVLVDGRSVYTPLSGGVFWISLPLVIDDIERIEVIRGPNAASYGSNSFLGVINIITRHASQDQGTFVKLASGEHNVRDGVVRHGWAGERGQSRVTFSYQQDDGFAGLSDHTKSPIVTFRGDYRMDPGNTLELQLGTNAEKHGEGELDDPLDRPREARSNSHFQLLRWRHTVTPENEVSLQFFHNYRRYEENYLTDPFNLPPFGIVQVPISYDQTEERYDFELQHVFSPLPNWRLAWGGGARLDRGRAPFYLGNDDWQANRIQSVFGNAEWRLAPNSIVNLGAMWEKHSLFDTELSPRIAFNQHLSPRHTLRFATSKATRMPSIVDEKANAIYKYQGVDVDQYFVSPGNLKAETLRSSEIGYLGQIPEINTSIDVRVFHDRIRSLLTHFGIPAADLNGKTTTVRNEGGMDIRGAETQLIYRPLPTTRFILSYASMHGKATDFIVNAASQIDEHERSVPVFIGSMLAMHRFSSRWEASANYHRVSESKWFNNGDLVDGYSRVDVRLARDYRVGEYKGQLAVTVQNTGPVTRTFREENVFDRRTFVTLTLNR